ncbi:GNAT family N-acetyltransferase [Moritella sp. Urea-trap-13]|uniref:GNAT family N-acetyltransferase n=1 Tax=Moritella sp. Urea-trap-13 TaxID=2058327 RepID=UPI000C31DDD2|nr:GNAT family N-acetyltransferase [Moritella sp. Urea-trap-13]PKH07765.1 GNAT family N-acetyltransferase [Moritella sp. Urea-trap-13]
MEIVAYTPQYLPALRALYMVTRTSTFTWLDSSGYQIKDFDEHITDDTVYLVVADDKVLGFIAVCEPDNFIHHLFVADAAQGMGVGSALLTMLSELNGRPQILKCMVENEKAMQFYLRKGFAEVGKGTGSVGDYLVLKK